MIRGLYTAASGLITGLRMQEVVADSLANVGTPGFKGERSSATEFAGVLASRVADAPAPVPLRTRRVLGRVGTGAYVDERRTFLEAGAERATNQPLDVMIQGDGFFVVGTEAGLRYTRNGRFGRDAQNRVVTADGSPVLDVDGNEIVIETDRIRIDPDGRIARPVEVEVTQPDGSVAIEQQEELVARLQAVRLDVNALVRAGDSRFTLAPGAVAEPVELGEESFVRQGSLEEANVDIGRVASRMVSLARAFEANQRVFTTLNETLRVAATDVGRVNG